MKMFRLACLAALAAATLSAHQAAALSEDDKSMSTASGAPRFADPDEQTPSAVNLQGTGNAGGVGTDPSATHYDYDPSSGSYVPHKQ
jgi:opacity protein-like surface antigen